MIGNYLNDQKTGLWAYNRMNGDKYFEFNYSSKTITSLYSDELKSDSTFIMRDNNFVIDKVDNPQIYLGYENEAPIHLFTSIKLPIKIVENKIVGRSIASFVVDENGAYFK